MQELNSEEMIEVLSDTQEMNLRKRLFEEGRLLEQRLFEHYSGRGSAAACFRSILGYQNDDGGFGAGIEPDLMTPSSTAIGAETALYYCDALGWRDEAMLGQLKHWLAANLDDAGQIPHPPADIADYPHQPWWRGADEKRVFAVAGLLRLLGVDDPAVFKRVDKYATESALPEVIAFYDYPLLLYALYSREFSRRDEVISWYTSRLPQLLKDNADHFPLFSRYWYHAQSLVSQEALERERRVVLSEIDKNGVLPNPYPNLPHWEPAFTLDALVIIKLTT